MPYNVNWTPRASNQVLSLPPPLPTLIVRQVEKLALDPPAYSIPGRSTSPDGQLFEFRYSGAGAIVFVSITFRYGADEQTLFVENVATEFA